MFDTAGLDRPPEPGAFKEHIWSFYRDFGRSMPWRETQDTYAIFLSEIMLQQTQVPRVMEKYAGFLRRFPTFDALAAARLADVYEVWQGLGYNRRAKYLHDAARTIASQHRGEVPRDRALLEALPGVGPNTAGSLLAFCHNEPVVFIETNIRRVYIYFFFPGDGDVHDRDILPLVGETLDRENPREWYYALMDYGAVLKKWVTNPNRRSKQYVRQSPFENSNRQVRGRILRALSGEPALDADELSARVGYPTERVEQALGGLSRDGMVVAEEGKFSLP
jgi:A/G-specific adenine glycosylase